MNTYIPERWEIVNLKLDDLDINKVMSSWCGGFAGSDNWRLSSGITDVIENDNHYEIHNESGSVYICYKESQGMSAFTKQVYLDFKKNLKEEGGTLEIINIKDIK
jgi:hypothetical protein